jgi:hypothetical protein
MPIETKARTGARRLLGGGGWILGAALGCLFPSTPAAAATAIVDCSGQTAGAFTSVNAALGSLTGTLGPGEWDRVLLKSDCTENVVVTGGRRVWIAPEGSDCPFAGCPWGPALRISAASATADVVNISGPQEVTLVHLVLSGGTTGLRVAGTATVTTFDVVAEDNTGAGIAVAQGASININEGGARRNGWFGITCTENSYAHLQGAASWLHGESIVVTDNRGGLWVDRGAMDVGGGVRVDGNHGAGVVAYGANLLFGAWVGESLIQNNAGGVYVSEGSQVTLWTSGTGTTTIRNNGTYGVYTEKNSHVSIYDVLVEGHTEVGVDVVMNSQAALHGTRVQGNGSAPRRSMGLRVDGSSQAYLDEARLTDNRGPGVVVDLNSSVEARATVVTGNGSEGFRVRSGSFLALGSGGTLQPNGGPPVTCDALSHVVTRALSSSPACRNVDRPSQPRPVRPPNP